MQRIRIIAGHVGGTDVQDGKVSSVAPQLTAAHGVKVFPHGKKHFVTDPRERLARYEGDGGATKASTIPIKFRERVRACGKLHVLAQKRGARDGAWTRWTWEEYHAEVMQVAQSLIALGCGQHEAVNILGFNSPEWYFAASGAIFSGLTPAGIYITNGPDGVQYILEHSKAPVIFVDSEPQLQKVLSVKARCPNLKYIVHWGNDCPAEGNIEGLMSWKSFLAYGAKKSTPAEVEARIAAQKPDNCCYLSYTSGTTGNPKAVMYSHDNVLWGLGQILQRCIEVAAHNGGVGLEEREVSFLPLSHIAGNVQLLGAMTFPPTMNSQVHFAFPDAMQGSLPDTLKEVRPTIFSAVPRVWEKFGVAMQQAVKAKPELLQTPKVVLGAFGIDQAKVSSTGAAPISEELMQFYDSLGSPIYEIYGMTENTCYSHFNRLNKRKIGSVGPAMTDEGAGAKLHPETNEICVWSRGVMMGYMYMPEKTADTFDDEGFLCSGDVGHVDEDGFTFITGRIKEMIITGGGENCAPVLLEQAIKQELPALSNVMMVGDKQKFLTALLTLKLEPNTVGGFSNKLFAEATAVDPACKTLEEALKSDVWKQYIERGIEAANKVAVSRAQSTRKWSLIPGDFSPFGTVPELTPTLKLKRDIVQKKHLEVIKSMYGSDFVQF